MIELNAVGWSALLAPSALIGASVALALGRPVGVGALGGAGAALAVAVAWDRWRRRNSMVSVSSDLGLDVLRRVVDRLRAEGVDVTLDAVDSGLVVAPGSERNEDVDRWSLATRQRWLNRVIGALADAPVDRGPD